MSHQFQHLDKKWNLYKKRTTDTHYYFSPCWGDHGQKVHHCLRDKATNRALTLPEAEVEARNFITARFKDTTQYEKIRALTKLRGATTVGHLIDEWRKAGYPTADRRPRQKAQQDRHAELLPSIEKWWRTKLVPAINGPMIGDYAEWRRQNCRTGAAGHRVTDRDLGCLYCCFDWAVASGRAQSNPFRDRPRFYTTADTVHCPAYMPGSDEELHQLLGHMMADPDPWMVVAGAQFMFQALAGLRPGECDFLRWDAEFRGSYPEPGHRYTVSLEGIETELIAIRRLKGGINPAIRVRPVLAQFLAAWKSYSRPLWDSPWYFPDPHNPDQPYAHGHKLNLPLNRATEALNLGERHPHSMRAFYVRVRRSQGADDGAIAVELGQGSGAKLVVQTYGDSRGIHGDGRFDWLPSPDSSIKLAWDRLRPSATTNIVQL